jgi:hypothetical protein
MNRKKFEIVELEERIAPSSLSVGSVLGGVGSAANGSPTTGVGSVGDVGAGHIGSGNSVSPAVDALHGNSVDALHDNALSAGGLNASNNSPTINVAPSVSANVNVEANGADVGGGL